MKTLEEASKAYYAGNPIITDEEFDAAVVKLKLTDPENLFLKKIGAPIPGTVKAKHKIPMGSLSNANNEEEFRAWVPEGQPFLCLSHKLDGSSLELIYENGQLVQAITRGDGDVGEDVTRNVMKSPHVPKTIDPSIVSVRCECLIHKNYWEEYFKGDANPRNSAAGTLRRHDGRNAEHLRFYAFDALYASFVDYMEYEVLADLSQWFDVPSYAHTNDLGVILNWCDREERARDGLAYEIDGVVAKIDDRAVSKEMGITNNRPKGQIAFKFKPRGGETVLRKVVWQVGQTGALTPVGEVDPVGVGGTIIKRVTLCNMDEIRRLGIAISDAVEIIRAGDTIPKLSKRIKASKFRENICRPTACPECGRGVVLEGARIFCKNDSCPGKTIGGVMNWIKKRNILNLGVGFVKAAGIKSIIHLYEMTLDEWANITVKNGVLGQKRAKKIVDALEKSKSMTLSDFLGSIGIKGVGRSLASDLCYWFNPEMNGQLTIDDIMRLTDEQVARPEKFGALRAADFCDWLREHRDEVMELASIMKIDEKSEKNVEVGVFENEVICFTGASPKPRPEMRRLAESAGASVSSSVSKKTTILVIADIESMSSKAVKARELGITLMSPQDFFAKLL